MLLGRLLGIESMNGAFELANTSVSLLEDTEEGVPWDVTAIRINWLPHLAVDQVSDSASAAGWPTRSASRGVRAHRKCTCKRPRIAKPAV